MLARLLNVSVASAFVCGLILLFFGGRIELSLQKDVEDVQKALIADSEVRSLYGTVIEADAIPNPFDKGFARLQKMWEVHESGSERSGYYTFRVLGAGNRSDGKRIVGEVKAHYRRNGSHPVEVSAIEFL